jgi:hypothetical protein
MSYLSHNNLVNAKSPKSGNLQILRFLVPSFAQIFAHAKLGPCTKRPLLRRLIYQSKKSGLNVMPAPALSALELLGFGCSPVEISPKILACLINAGNKYSTGFGGGPNIKVL